MFYIDRILYLDLENLKAPPECHQQFLFLLFHFIWLAKVRLERVGSSPPKDQSK